MQHDAGQAIATHRAVTVPATAVLLAVPPDIVEPAEHEPHGDRIRSRVLDLPLEDPDRKAALAIVAWDDRAELPLDEVHGEGIPVVLEPCVREESVVGACAFGQVPVPGPERVWLDGRQDVG